jgi:hypothetical protein
MWRVLLLISNCLRACLKPLSFVVSREMAQRMLKKFKQIFVIFSHSVKGVNIKSLDLHSEKRETFELIVYFI